MSAVAKDPITCAQEREHRVDERGGETGGGGKNKRFVVPAAWRWSAHHCTHFSSPSSFVFPLLSCLFWPDLKRKTVERLQYFSSLFVLSRS